MLRNININSKIRNASARVSKAKTLDGADVVIHNGFIEADRSLRIQAWTTLGVADNFWELFTTQTFVNVAIADGVYNGVIALCSVDKGLIKTTIELASELT